MLWAPARLDAVAAELDEYFGGRRTSFDLRLDWRLSRGFRATVLHRLAADLGYGQTASYGAVARLVGNPRAARAVGAACATSPLPVVVPCPRVVRADGSLSGYIGGRETPWPDTLDEWLDMCHAAGQTKSTAILLKYAEGDWNALHRDLRARLSAADRRQPSANPASTTPEESSCSTSSARAPSPARPPRSSRTGTSSSSPRATDRWHRAAAG